MPEAHSLRRSVRNPVRILGPIVARGSTRGLAQGCAGSLARRPVEDAAAESLVWQNPAQSFASGPGRGFVRSSARDLVEQLAWGVARPPAREDSVRKGCRTQGSGVVQVLAPTVAQASAKGVTEGPASGFVRRSAGVDSVREGSVSHGCRVRESKQSVPPVQRGAQRVARGSVRALAQQHFEQTPRRSPALWVGGGWWALILSGGFRENSGSAGVVDNFHPASACEWDTHAPGAVSWQR
jgi:hypothetical protein